MKKTKICSYCKKEFNNYTSNSTKTCSDKCRFMLFVNIQENGCWIWNNHDPHFTFKRIFTTTAKCASYRLFVDENYRTKISGYMIRPNCFNEACINPEHLIQNSVDNYLINRKCTHCNNILTKQNAVTKCTKKRGNTFLAVCKICNHLASQKENSKRIMQLNCCICGNNTVKSKYPTLRTCSDECRFKEQYKYVENGCYLWTGVLSHKLPRFYIRSTSKSINAQKYAFWMNQPNVLTLEQLLKGTFSATNKCGNVFCVNADHIFIQLSAIKTAKSQSKLNYQQLSDLKYKYFTENWSYGDLSKHFNLSKPCVAKIISDKRSINFDASFDDTPTSNKERLLLHTCLNCLKNHDNIGSEYCSTQCMQEYLLK